MRFATIAALAAPALATQAMSASELKNNLGVARVHNRCPYPVYLWSVKKDEGCDASDMTMLKPGESYSEQYRDDRDEIGVSIKISKSNRCKGLIAANENIDITQLEYHINHADKDFHFNFLDVSFVDCLGEDCPGRDKFYLKSGNNGDVRLATAGLDKAVCPILSCSSKEECATMAYILPDDVQTKTCEPAADMDFYMCVDNPEDGPTAEEPEEEYKEEKKPEPSSIKEAPKIANKAATNPEVTPAPQDVPVREKKIKTEVVYVTKYEYVNAHKRHAHGHAHKRFHA